MAGTTSTHAQRKAMGDYGERLAARHLTAQGMVVVDRNWRCEVGEIDIVALAGDTVVVCEVKTRSGGQFGSPLEAITAAKAARLHRLGRLWLAAHPTMRYGDVRLDVVSVLRGRRGKATIEHVVGVA